MTSPLPESGLFSSARERRLWLWTLAVVVAIYSTLGLAASLADVLRNRGLIDWFSVAAFLLIGLSILTHGLTTRPTGYELVVALGVGGVYSLVLARMSIPEERTHLAEYGVVAVFVFEALSERARQGRRVPAPAVLAATLASLVGILDECIQAVLPSRVFDWRDILFNVLASVMAVSASVALRWARRRAVGEPREGFPD